MKNKKPKEKTKRIEIVKTLLLIVVLAILFYIIYMIYGLIKHPTNIFVVENGKLTMEEEAIRIYY